MCKTTTLFAHITKAIARSGQLLRSLFIQLNGDQYYDLRNTNTASNS
ncbi:MAG: hypothetical protein ACYTXL_02115 [Nostoc sp.]